MFESYMLNEIDSRSYVVELFSVALCTKVEGVDSRPESELRNQISPIAAIGKRTANTQAGGPADNVTTAP